VLHLLVIENVGGTVMGLKLQALGETSMASTLSYLDNGVVYVGSAAGNSQLVRLQAAPDETGSHVELLESFPGLGPICDFAVVDLERQGQCQVVTCSGLGKDGSLRVVRNGVGVNEQACVELPGIKGIWALYSADSDAHHSMLVVTFISETRVLAISAEDEMDETDVPGFDCAAQTLLCTNTAHNQLLQVTPDGVYLVDAATRKLAATWVPPAGMAITAAAADGHQLLLGVGGGHVVYLEVGGIGLLREAGRRLLEHEVSCLDCHSIGADGARLAAVGLWNHSILLLALPELTTALEEHVAGEAIPRSVLVATLEPTHSHLLVGLGDGNLLTYSLDLTGGLPALSDCKKLALGTQPITLNIFRSKAATHAFAASDRPAVIYSVNRKLMFSNVNLREVSHMCCFNSSSFPDSLAVATGGTLSIGTVDEIQKLHIRAVPLGEQPRRIAHQVASRSFLVACLKPTLGAESMDCDTADECVLRLLDDQSFDTLAVHPLSADELVCSLTSAELGDVPGTPCQQFYCVGTAFIVADEMEPSRGRILLFAVDDGKLSLMVRMSVRTTCAPLA
jgi:DNA damage-binding protein 1